ncbi:unnamed protein product, partial [Ascophyllum nodosum]
WVDPSRQRRWSLHGSAADDRIYDWRGRRRPREASLRQDSNIFPSSKARVT